MNRHGTYRCVRRVGLLLVLMGAPAAAGQVTLSASPQRFDALVGRGVALADFNGDGNVDAFVVCQETWETHGIRVLPGNGHGRFADSGQAPTADGPADQPVVLDLDGNGTKDVLVGRAVWLNDGHGRFTAGRPVLIDADNATLRSAKLADMNGDGAADLVFAASVGPDRVSEVRVYLNDGKGHFKDAGQARVPGIASAVAVGDLNGDGAPDIVVSGWRTQPGDACPNRVLLNDGKGRLTDSGQQLDEGGRHSHSVVVGDLDGDGDLDVIVGTQGTAPGAHVYTNDGKGHFTSGARIGAGSVEKVALVDLDGDGRLDVLLACIGPDEVWVNDGSGRFADAGLRLGQDWSWELAVADLDGDRLPDVFVVNFSLDSSAPPEKSQRPRPSEVWLNTSRKR